MTATPVRPKWVTAAAIAAGIVVGGIAFAVTYSLVLNAFRPGSPPAAEQPTDSPPPTPPRRSPMPPVRARVRRPAPQPNKAAERHREAVDALIRAYNEIADGYARIRDAGSIPAGNAPISRGSRS